MFDTHIHTQYSSDSKMSIEMTMKKAEEKKLGIIITEHIDLDYPDEKLFKTDVELYINDYDKWRNKNLLLGIEIGMSPGFEQQYEDICNKYSFDFVLGSVHEVNHMDLYEEEKLYELPKNELYNAYFKLIEECVDLHPFVDSLAHIDYIARYARYEDKEMYYDDFQDGIDRVLRSVIDKGICLEVNSRRLSNKEVIQNFIKIFKRYYELGGKYVTIGSDAHDIEGIGKNFDSAKQIADLCNLKMVYFEGRKLKYV